jgi:hypothetical protein
MIYYKYNKEQGGLHMFASRPFWFIALMKLFGYHYIGPMASYSPEFNTKKQAKEDAVREGFFKDCLEEMKATETPMFAREGKEFNRYKKR